jgi:hypothetical protein
MEHLTRPASDPVWAQTGITVPEVAAGYLRFLRRQDVLFCHSGDGEPDWRPNWVTEPARGLGLTLSRQIIAAARPPRDLWDLHRALGLGPEEIWVPSKSRGRPLVEACLEDDDMLARMKLNPGLRALCVRYKGTREEKLAARWGLGFEGGAATHATYAALNDKAALSAAGRKHGFTTLPSKLVSNGEELAESFHELQQAHGAGCILRRRMGAGGSGMMHAPTLSVARRVFRTMGKDGEMLLTPFVPPERVTRNLSLHGIMTPGGFAPLVLTDQIMRGFTYRGSRLASDLTCEELEAVRSCLPGLGNWLLSAGYSGAPAGVDGFLMRSGSGHSFVIIDPNIRLTNTIRPWSVVAALSESAGRSFVWQVEWMAFIGNAIDMNRIRRKLGKDLLDPNRLEEGGILPGYLGRWGWGPLSATRTEMLLLALDADHLKHLRRRISTLGFRRG